MSEALQHTESGSSPPEGQVGVVSGGALGRAIGIQPIASIGHVDTSSEVGTLQRDSFQKKLSQVHSTTWLTFAQVADLLQVTPGTVSKWSLQDASFPATRLPGRVLRVERAALDRWLKRLGRSAGRNSR